MIITKPRAVPLGGGFAEVGARECIARDEDAAGGRLGIEPRSGSDGREDRGGGIA